MLSKNDGGGPVLQKRGKSWRAETVTHKLLLFPTLEFLQSHQNSTLFPQYNDVTSTSQEKSMFAYVRSLEVGKKTITNMIKVEHIFH